MTKSNFKRGHSRMCQIVIFTLIFAVFLSYAAMPAQASQSLVHIQVTIDPAAWEFVGSVVTETMGTMQQSPEVTRIGEEHLTSLASGLFSGISLLNGGDPELSEAISTYGEDSFTGIPVGSSTQLSALSDSHEINRVLSFPGDTSNNNGYDSSSEDFSQAMAVYEDLFFDLNTAWKSYLDSKHIDTSKPDVKAFKNHVVAFLSTVNSNKRASAETIGSSVAYYTTKILRDRNTTVQQLRAIFPAAM